MHLLGCLDRPSSGCVLRVGGRDVSTMSDSELAELRNTTVGFVFQSFQLLARTTAIDNVALPLVYRGVRRGERKQRAGGALREVGLGHRLRHRPTQMSGGEQQRVAIARAGGGAAGAARRRADGNLDTRTGDEVMTILEQLNAERDVAIVLVTHEADIARRARRQLHVRDGQIESDSALILHEGRRGSGGAGRASANRLRSVLTMIGVIVGVAAVVVLVAIGTGAKNEVETQVEGLGSNLILVVPGRLEANSGPTVSRSNSTTWRPWPESPATRNRVTTTVTSGEMVTSGARESFVTVQGTTQTYPDVFDRPLTRGRYLSAADVETRRRIVVLGSQVAQEVFPGVDPLGRQVSLAGVRFRVIGVFAETGAAFGFSRDTEVHVPVTAAQRLLGVDRIDGLAVKAPTTDGIEDLQDRLVTALQEEYPGDEPAVTQTQILGTIGRILNLLTPVLAAIAGISLLVGGVGVSNIMLVSVRERTREIGLRKALGARQRDILLQFLIEAVLLTTIGGVLGIGLGVGSSPAHRRGFATAGGHLVVVAPAGVWRIGGCRRVLRRGAGASCGSTRPVVALRTE